MRLHGAGIVRQRWSAGCWVLLAAKIAAGWRAAGSGHAHRGGTVGGMPPRVYHPDHTAHIRRRLTRMAVTGLIGLAVAAAAAGVLAMMGSRAGDSSSGLVTAAWVADAACAAVAVLYLLVTLAAWAVYRRRRADLDAEGAEIVGETQARIANRHRDS
jgi:hypothetical protein